MPTIVYSFVLLFAFLVVGTDATLRALYSEQLAEQAQNNAKAQKDKDEKDKKDKTLTATWEPTKTPKKTDTPGGPTATPTETPTATPTATPSATVTRIP